MRSVPTKNGFTIVELLVAASIVGILLSVVSVFFSQQANVTRQTQASQEAAIKARMVAELLIQDLQVAGSSVVFNGGVSQTVQIGCSAGGATKCIDAPGGGAGIKDRVSMIYATSLRPEEPCRRVSYDFSGSTWRRGEAACGSNINHQPLASNVLSLNIEYTCADKSLPTVPDPATCYTDRKSFPRQAKVTVEARADDVDTVKTKVELTTAMPNLRY